MVEPAGPPPITSTSVCCAASGATPSIMARILDLRPANVVPPAFGSALLQWRCSGQLLFDETRQCGDARMIEDIGDIDQPRPQALDTFVDCDQLERTGADVEQTLVGVDAAAIQLLFADAAQLLRDGVAVDACHRLPGAQPRQLRQLGAEGAIEIFLFQQMALELAAGGLGD